MQSYFKICRKLFVIFYKSYSEAIFIEFWQCHGYWVNLEWWSQAKLYRNLSFKLYLATNIAHHFTFSFKLSLHK